MELNVKFSHKDVVCRATLNFLVRESKKLQAGANQELARNTGENSSDSQPVEKSDNLRQDPDTLRQDPDTLRRDADNLRQDPDNLRQDADKDPDILKEDGDNLKEDGDSVREMEGKDGEAGKQPDSTRSHQALEMILYRTKLCLQCGHFKSALWFLQVGVFYCVRKP